MKVFSYLAAGRPILAPDLPDTADINVNCMRVPADNSEAAAAALEKLFADRVLSTRLGERAAVDAMGNTWESRAEKIIAYIEKRKKQKTSSG